MVFILFFIYLFQANIMGHNFESVVFTLFSSFASPFLFIKDFDKIYQNKKEEKAKQLKLRTFYGMNKITTSVTLLTFLVISQYSSCQLGEFDSQDEQEVYNGTTEILQWSNYDDYEETDINDYDYEVVKLKNTPHKHYYLHLFFPYLVVWAIISLMDGTFTLLSEYSIVLLRKESKRNLGVTN